MSRIGLRFATGLVAVLSIASPAGAQVAFSDQALAAGLDYTPDTFFDTLGQGMFPGGAVGDFDRDGWPDLFLLGGGNTPDALFMNNGDGTFTDHAADWGVDVLHRGRAAAVGDFNSDGWPDIYVTSSGGTTLPAKVGVHKLYKNGGDGTFTDVAVAAGVNQVSPTNTIAAGAAFGDYDLDGDLDLFVCTWEGFDGNLLFRNNGDETFTDVTVAAGIDNGMRGFAPRFVDMNGDRYPELLLVADFVTGRYFVNNQDGTFTNATLSSGTCLEDNGMGTTVADFNRDGLPDWYVTSIYNGGTVKDGNYLYVNQGNDVYTVLPESSGARDGGWGWGTDSLDFDHDGWVDLAETNGWNSQEFLADVSFLFRNNGDMTFSEAQGGTSGFDHVAQGRALLLFDYDRDGDMDIVITSYDEPVALFRNDVSGPDTNWLEIELDTSGDPGLAPDGFGSRIIATTGGVSQYFWLNGGSTYLGTSQPVAHFGLGSATVVDTLVVEWGNGTDTVLLDVAANQILTMSPSVAGAPGEASSPSDPAEQMLATYDPATGEIDVSYTPSCGASNHTIYYGDLANVGSYDYTGAACWCGNSGSTSFAPAGVSSAFFMIVGNTGTLEGSYGLDGLNDERPEDTATPACDLPQDLSSTCDLP